MHFIALLFPPRCVVLNIRLAIFEPTRMSCDLMSRALAEPSYGIQVTCLGVSSELTSKTQLGGANVALIGSSLAEGHLSGLNLLQQLSKTDRNLHCVLLLDQDERHIVIEAFRSGAVGVFQRDQPYEQLIKC